MLDWMAQLFGLPECFHYAQGGGGAIYTTSSDALFYTIAAARERAILECKALGNKLSRGELLDRLVAYTSVEVNGLTHA